MRRCTLCKTGERVWAWQPFGPDDTPLLFAPVGNHYRGYPVIGVCIDCRLALLDGYARSFRWRGQRWTFTDGTLTLDAPHTVPN